MATVLELTCKWFKDCIYLFILVKDSPKQIIFFLTFNMFFLVYFAHYECDNVFFWNNVGTKGYYRN